MLIICFERLVELKNINLANPNVNNSDNEILKK